MRCPTLSSAERRTPTSDRGLDPQPKESLLRRGRVPPPRSRFGLCSEQLESDVIYIVPCAGCDTLVILESEPKDNDLVLCGQCECECVMALSHEAER